MPELQPLSVPQFLSNILMQRMAKEDVLFQTGILDPRVLRHVCDTPTKHESTAQTTSTVNQKVVFSAKTSSQEQDIPSWWFQPLLKNMSQNVNLPQVGVKMVPRYPIPSN